jgi:hypothetical protein
MPPGAFRAERTTWAAGRSVLAPYYRRLKVECRCGAGLQVSGVPDTVDPQYEEFMERHREHIVVPWYFVEQQ